MWRCAIGGIVPRMHKRPRRTFRAAVIRGHGSRIGGYLNYSMAVLDDDRRAWCDAIHAARCMPQDDADLLAWLVAERAMLDAALADDRAMLDALQAADLAFLRSLR